MPLPASDFIFPDLEPSVTVTLEPAHNIHHSLVLMAQIDKFSGLDEWIYRTAAAMTQEERDTNELVMIGLHYAAIPDASYPSFPAYLDALAMEPALHLRNRVLDAYIDMAGDQEASYDEILADVNAFMAFLRRGFDDDHILPDVERRAYTYLLDPPAMQQLVVGHMRSMWYKYLAVEWERVRPILQKSVRAFETIDLSAMDRFDAVEYVVGRPFKKDWCKTYIEESEQLIFVPSVHVGPYTKVYPGEGKTWLLFGARQPEDAGEVVSELSRADLLVRLNALSDDTRLSILKLIVEQGELKSQDIMQLLDLSQSAASRHLQQLAAAGFLLERRCNGAKCYELNSERIDTTLKSLGAYLSPVVTTAESNEGRVPATLRTMATNLSNRARGA